MTLPPSAVLKATSGQMLGVLGSVLRKGEAYADSLGVHPSVLLDDRLFPNMFPLSRQVQIACDQVTRGGARLSGVDLPSFPDTETTFAQLAARAANANAYVQGLDSTLIDGRADADITFPVGAGNEMTMKSWAFLLNYILPNLYFHTTTAYNILRKNGVVLGKRDFLSPN